MAQKLTDTQLIILSNASQREDGMVFPLPETMTLNKGAVASVLKGLLKRDFVVEVPVPAGDAVWREAPDGGRVGLKITDSALNLLGLAPAEDEKPTEKPKRSKKASAKDVPSARPGTKQSILIDLLQRKRGATVEEIMEQTGWQAHSVRGAISGTLKKKLGLLVTSEKVDKRGRVYRIAGQA
ncbi:MAG: DUF3489 domain-containing protein [Alphaproteobacteria bacterium]